MKKPIYLLIAFVQFIQVFAFAGNGFNYAAQGKQLSKDWLFKPLASKDVSLEVERVDGDINLHLYSQSMWGIDMIYVEKSKDPTDGFTRCKTVKVADHLILSKSYIGVVDEMPYASNIDCYYRIRTVSPSGATKIYPAVSLAPVFETETIETVER